MFFRAPGTSSRANPNVSTEYNARRLSKFYRVLFFGLDELCMRETGNAHACICSSMKRVALVSQQVARLAPIHFEPPLRFANYTLDLPSCTVSRRVPTAAAMEEDEIPPWLEESRVHTEPMTVSEARRLYDQASHGQHRFFLQELKRSPSCRTSGRGCRTPFW